MPGALSSDKKNTLIFVFSSVVFAPMTKTSKEGGREREGVRKGLFTQFTIFHRIILSG